MSIKPIEENSDSTTVDRRRATEKNRRIRLRRIVLIASLVILIFSLTVPLTGYYYVFVKPLNETALVINDKSHSWNDYLTRTKMLIYDAQFSGTWDPNSLSSLIFDMLDEMERLEIVNQYASQEGLTINPEDIDREIRFKVLGRGSVDDPTMSDAEFEERYRRRLELLKVNEDTFYDIVRQSMLIKALDEKLRESVPEKIEQRHFYVIQVSNLEDARLVLEKIDAGQKFEEIAKEMSRDIQSKDSGGDVGWIPVGVREDYDEAIYTLGDGQISEPLFSRAGVSILKAEGNVEIRTLKDEHRSRLETGALTKWIRDKRSDLIEEEALSRPGGSISNERYEWIIEQIMQERELFPRRTVSG
ncbi:MAG: peptidylprolyl isomerase [Dehalococcoidia bacterium]